MIDNLKNEVKIEHEKINNKKKEIDEKKSYIKTSEKELIKLNEKESIEFVGKYCAIKFYIINIWSELSSLKDDFEMKSNDFKKEDNDFKKLKRHNEREINKLEDKLESI
jgi:hypothetical protein